MFDPCHNRPHLSAPNATLGREPTEAIPNTCPLHRIFIGTRHKHSLDDTLDTQNYAEIKIKQHCKYFKDFKVLLFGHLWLKLSCKTVVGVWFRGLIRKCEYLCGQEDDMLDSLILYIYTIITIIVTQMPFLIYRMLFLLFNYCKLKTRQFTWLKLFLVLNTKPVLF